MESTTKPNWLTPKQLSDTELAFSLSAIRNILFLASDRKTSKGIIKGNGLAPHVRRLGSKVLINHAGFLSWIDGQQGSV